MFKKYTSLTNDYSSKSIAYWLKYNPELQDMTFQITEKIDGANVQFLFTPHQPMKAGKRTAFVSKNSNFMGLWATVPKYQTQFNALQNWVDKEDVTLRIYGEVYGQGIQKNRVWYGDEKYISFFNGLIDDNWMTPVDFVKLLTDLSVEDMHVPILGYVEGLEAVLTYQHDFFSYAGDKKPSGQPNITEGIVAKPANKIYTNQDDSVFFIKRKNELFSEKTTKESRPVDTGLMSWHLKFKGYINENRVLSVFSKEGEIEAPNQIGRYIQLVIADALEDFLDDHPELDYEGLEKKEQKVISNVGRQIVTILKQYL